VLLSLDPSFGLDNSAVTTLQRWRFAPGTYNGQAVPVLISVSMFYTLK
jgi:hypothetical protein